MNQRKNISSKLLIRSQCLDLNSVLTFKEQIISTTKRGNSLKTEEIKELTLRFFIDSVQRKKKSFADLQVIMAFLQKLIEFKNLLKVTQGENYHELLYSISNLIGYTFYEDNKILFRYGDVGDRFFIIAKGKVDILIPREKKVELNAEEFHHYLDKLKELNEIEILSFAVLNNQNTFSDLDEIKEELVIRNQENVGEKLNEPKFIKSEDYLRKVYPDFFPGSIKRRVVKILYYYHICTLKDGEFFGDTALTKPDLKRNATIITREKTHFLFLTKDVYDKTIKEAAIRSKKNDFAILLNTAYFSNIDRNFLKHNFECFVFKRYRLNDILIREGERCDDVFFLKSGEFELSCKKSLIEINDFLKIRNQKNTEFLDREMMDMSRKFEKFMNQKRKLKISIVKNNEILGFDDLTIDGKYEFTIKSITSNSEVFRIKKEFFTPFLQNEVNNQLKIKDHIESKQKCILERLKHIKFTLIQHFKQTHLKENDEFHKTPKINSVIEQNPIEVNQIRLKKPTKLNLLYLQSKGSNNPKNYDFEPYTPKNFTHTFFKHPHQLILNNSTTISYNQSKECKDKDETLINNTLYKTISIPRKQNDSNKKIQAKQQTLFEKKDCSYSCIPRKKTVQSLNKKGLFFDFLKIQSEIYKPTVNSTNFSKILFDNITKTYCDIPNYKKEEMSETQKSFKFTNSTLENSNGLKPVKNETSLRRKVHVIDCLGYDNLSKIYCNTVRNFNQEDNKVVKNILMNKVSSKSVKKNRDDKKIYRLNKEIELKIQTLNVKK